MAAAAILFSSALLWVLTIPAVNSDPAVTRTLYYIVFSVGGVGYSVPLGLLIAGISVTSAFMKVLPRWLWVSGIVIALIGELSWFSMIHHDLLPLIPLTRFPGFIWLIIVGFRMPNKLPRP